MKVNWQSNTPSLELTVPVGSYLPYELPIATKEELGGVKIDGDTITITKDGVISSKQVDLSGVATQEELDQVKESIPDTSSFATKTEVEEAAAKIPSEYLKTANVADNKLTITDASGTSLEFQGGSDSDFVINYSYNYDDSKMDKTYDEILDAWNNKKNIILNNDGLIMPLLGYKIMSDGFTFLFTMVISENEDGSDPFIETLWVDIAPDSTLTEKVYDIMTQEFAKKDDLATIEAKIPIEYLKSATLDGNKLTLTDATGTNVDVNFASNERFIVNFDALSYEADKTNAEIYAAVKAGKKVYGDYFGFYIPLSVYSSTSAVFASTGATSNTGIDSITLEIENDKGKGYYLRQDFSNYATKTEVQAMIDAALSNSSGGES